MKKLLLSFLLLTTSFLISSCEGTPPKDLGVQDQGPALKKCPESPNCVISFYPQDKEHYLEPIKTEHPSEKAYKNILNLLQKFPRVTIVKKRGNYIRAEFKSSVFGFVDDVEFYFGETGKIHFRSASRMGHWDLGVNHDRMEKIRFKYQQRDY